MRVLLSSNQMRLTDIYTIANKPIASIDLMEEASLAFTGRFMEDESIKTKRIVVFCGQGNNGGDGLAIARILWANDYRNLSVYVANFSDQCTEGFKINFERLQQRAIDLIEIKHPSELVTIQADVVIDALLGSGLNKPLSGNFEALVRIINNLNAKIYAVDVPSGFFAEAEINIPYNGIKAFKTICFQRPKINFFLPESILATQHFEVVPIGLDEGYIQNQASSFYLTEKRDIKEKLIPRANFTHKGTFGHALIIAGSEKTMGAALLSSSACLHTGAGLVSASIPSSGLIALNILLPELMYVSRSELNNLSAFDAIAIGPGLGKDKDAEQILETLVTQKKSLIVDADALNILADRKDLLALMPKNSIITPHLKEFDRLFGEHKNWWHRIKTAQEQAKKLEIVIVLKNQYTLVCLPNAKIFINPTGNPAMAQGGMGDVLTGVIAGFLAQGYIAADAAILACYLHGKAGDTLAKKQYVVSASQVALQITKEIKKMIVRE